MGVATDICRRMLAPACAMNHKEQHEERAAQQIKRFDLGG
jgi:hypothetical protein